MPVPFLRFGRALPGIPPGEGETITVSAGKIGYQICCRPADLIALVGARVADVV